MPGFKVDKILHGIELKISPATKAYETKIQISPRFRPKKFRTEVMFFPQQNNDYSRFCGQRFYISYVHFSKGLAKGSLILDEAYFVQGETEKTFHQTMKLMPAQKKNELPAAEKTCYLNDINGNMYVNDIAAQNLI